MIPGPVEGWSFAIRGWRRDAARVWVTNRWRTRPFAGVRKFSPIAPRSAYAEVDVGIGAHARVGSRCERLDPTPKKGGIVFQVLHREEGQGLAEYALILSFVAIAAVAALAVVGNNLVAMLNMIGKGL